MNYEVGKWYLGKANRSLFVARFSHTEKDSLQPTILWFYFTELYFFDGHTSGDYNRVSCSTIEGLATPAQIEQCLKAYAEIN